MGSLARKAQAARIAPQAALELRLPNAMRKEEDREALRGSREGAVQVVLVAWFGCIHAPSSSQGAVSSRWPEVTPASPACPAYPGEAARAVTGVHGRCGNAFLSTVAAPYGLRAFLDFQHSRKANLPWLSQHAKHIWPRRVCCFTPPRRRSPLPSATIASPRYKRACRKARKVQREIPERIKSRSVSPCPRRLPRMAGSTS